MELQAGCRLIGENSPQPLLLVTGERHALRYINPAFCGLLGKKAEDLLDREFDEVVEEGAANGWSQMIDRVYSSVIGSLSSDTEHPVRPGQDTRWWCYVWTLVNDDNKHLGILVQLSDATMSNGTVQEVTAVNEALLLSAVHQHELREEAEQSNKNLSAEISVREEAQAALRDLTLVLETRVEERTADMQKANLDLQGFTYSVAHDLRAPLRAIIATSKILKLEAAGQLTPEFETLLDRQASNAAKLAELIDDLLQFARLANQGIRMVPIDLTHCSEDVAMNVASSYPDRKLDFDIQEGMTTEGDPTSVMLVLQNLIDNAAKFSPQGGKIRVGRESDGEGAFYVQDEGIGFDAAYRHKLFNPFQRLVNEQDFPGTGIGLANVRRIVERHRGSVWAHSEQGKGATFYFTLK